jgi:hypothetical protein
LPNAAALNATVLGPAAVAARWRLHDGAILTLATNLGGEPVPLRPPHGGVLFESAPESAGSVVSGRLPARATVAWLRDPRPVLAMDISRHMLFARLRRVPARRVAIRSDRPRFDQSCTAMF